MVAESNVKQNKQGWQLHWSMKSTDSSVALFVSWLLFIPFTIWDDKLAQAQ